MRVLLIEDNRDFAEIFSMLLQERGCEIDWEESATAGLQRAGFQTYDVIFCDIGLPGRMNGLEFAQSVRNERHLSEAFLISISGYTDVRHREEAVNAGFDYVLAKPVDFDDLDEILRKALRRFRP